MANFPFGKAFAIDWSPAVDGTPVAAYELVTARLYAAAPTTDQIEATDDGHIESVTTWAALSEPHTYRIKFAAVEDPEPHGAEPFEKYYVVVRFRFESGGEVKFDQEVVYLWRPDSTVSRIQVSPEQLTGREHKLKALRSTEQLTRFIESAKRKVIRHYRGLGYDQRRMFNLTELNDATEECALWLACLDIAGDGNRMWFEKANIYRAELDRVLSQSSPGYDTLATDAPEPHEKIPTGGVYLVR